MCQMYLLQPNITIYSAEHIDEHCRDNNLGAIQCCNATKGIVLKVLEYLILTVDIGSI
jgi:hypothetical protein